MAVTEVSGLMKYKDKNGNMYAMRPITTADNVDGLSDLLAQKAASVHTHTKSQISDFPSSLPASDVSSWAKASSKPTYTASEVGADVSGAAAQALTDAKSYTDGKIADSQKLDTPITASSSDGVAYTATVPGITALTAGYSFVMVPNKQSTSQSCTLNVNSLGAKTLRIRGTGYTSTTSAPPATNWMAANKPVRVTYDGMWWIADIVAPNSKDYTYGTTDLTAGTSTLATGQLYFVYE